MRNFGLGADAANIYSSRLIALRGEAERDATVALRWEIDKVGCVARCQQGQQAKGHI